MLYAMVYLGFVVTVLTLLSSACDDSKDLRGALVAALVWPVLPLVAVVALLAGEKGK